MQYPVYGLNDLQLLALSLICLRHDSYGVIFG